MVFIHGGGFTSGSSMADKYSGIPLASVGDVILVTINYRVGVTGFLATAFGGDSSKITIFGGSAGAICVDFHLISKYSQDLFDQAILEAQIRFGPTVDGTFLDESPITIIQRGDFKDCPVIVGFNRDEGTLSMRISFMEYAFTEEPPVINQSSFNMLVTETQTRYNPVRYEIVEDSIKQQYVDWLIGMTRPRLLRHNEPYIRRRSFQLSLPEDSERDRAMMTSHPVYLYFFTQVPTTSVFAINGYGPGWLGAGHAEEIQYVFGYPFIPEMQEWHGPMTDGENEFSVKFMQFWTNFAKSGDPSRPDSNSSPGQGDWEWPAFTIPELQYKELAIDMSIDRGLKADECAFWNAFNPDLTSYIASMDQTELEWREEFSGWQKDLEEWRMTFKEYQEDPVCSP
ncbi:putative cholinesterase 1 [Apostichopus japonicus]|uniref:Carboxylic ester hydrolase n=1 Tax=Stichopus japonicus TaxID=307972 RepID=A0A2G8KP00_STIJA|nr:putative cholinesterase 1 [Apostichopus japonicus]